MAIWQEALVKAEGVAQSQRQRRPYQWILKSAMGMWTVTSLAGKEPELVPEEEQ